MLLSKLKERCAIGWGRVHPSLEDVIFDAMVREMVGRHAWKLSERRAVELGERVGGRDRVRGRRHHPTGRYVQRRAAELKRSR